MSPEPVQSEPAISEPVQAAAPATPVVDDLSPAIIGLSARVEALESQISAQAQAQAEQTGSRQGEDQARTALQATGQLAQALNAIKAELATLNTRLNTLESTMESGAQTSGTGSASSNAQIQAQIQAMVLAVSQLQMRTSTDEAFVAELAALDQVAGVDSSVASISAALRPYAQGGTPTLDTLHSRFADTATAVMRAHGQSGETGWLSEIIDAVGSLVTVRRTDPAKIDDPVERALAVAEQALRANELQAAVAAVETLSTMGNAEMQAAQPWLNAANARLAVDGAMVALHASAVGALSNSVAE